MTVKRRWLVLASLVAVATTAAALVAASTGGASSGKAVRLDHRLGRRRPASGGEAVRQDAPKREGERRHLRRRRQRRDDDADEDPAVEPHGQGLAGRRLQRAGERPGLDVPAAVRLRPEPEGRLPGLAPHGLARAVARAVHGQRSPRLPAGQPRPGGALRQQEADGPVRLHRAEDVAGVGGARREGRQGAPRLHHRQHRATRTATGSTYGRTGARSRKSSRRRPFASTLRTFTAPAWRSCSIRCIKSGIVSPESVFTPSFAQKYGGDNDKILLMPGPTWYAKDIFGGTLKVPAGEMTAALPLRWNNEPPTTGQVGGGPWIVFEAHEERGSRDRLREVRHDVAGGQVEAGRAGVSRPTAPPPPCG